MVKLISLNILLWKHFIIERRRPIILISKLLPPILVIMVLTLISRFINTEANNLDNCFFQETILPSASLIGYFHSIMCRKSYTCSNSDTNRYEDIRDLFNYFNKWDMVFGEFMQLNGTGKDVEYNWLTTNEKKLEKLANELQHGPYATFYRLFLVFILEDPIDDNKNILYKYIIQNLCGTDNIENYNNIISLFLKKRDMDKTKIMTVINSFIGGLGKYIVYEPDNHITQQIMAKFEKIVIPIKKLLNASINWTKYAKKDLENTFLTKIDKKTKSIYEICKEKNTKICKQFVKFYENYYENFKTKSIEFITTLFEFIKFTAEKIPKKLVKPFSNISHTDSSVYAHVEFANIPVSSKKLPAILNYTIQMKQHNIDREYKYLISTDGYKVLSEHYHPYLLDDEVDKYYHSGFLTIQQVISHAFIELTTNRSVKIGTSLQYTPIPCSHFELMVDRVFSLLPTVLTVSWIICYTCLLNDLVSEKEHGIKEYLMKLESLNTYNNFVEFISFIFENIPVGIIASILLSIQFFHIKQIFELIVLHVGFFIALSSQIFVVSLFFTSTKLAGLIGAIIYMLSIYPCYFYMDQQTHLDYGWYLIFSIVPQSGYGIALDRMRLAAIDETPWKLDTIYILCFMLLSAFISMIIFYSSEILEKLLDTSKLFTWKNSVSNYGTTDSINMNASNIIFQRFSTVPSFEDSISNDNICVKVTKINKTVNGNLQIIRNLNLNLYFGQILSIVGHNGAGKSTTLSMIAGLIKPDNGTIRFFNLKQSDEDDAPKKVSIGLCPQTNVLYDNLTVMDHIIFYSQLRGVSLSLAIVIAPNIVKEMGLDYERNQNVLVKYLSPGYKRRLCIALAFTGDTRVVLLDEPTSSIDFYARRTIWNMLLSLKNSNKTIVISTNNMEEADYLSDHVAVLANGEMLSYGTPMYLKKSFGQGYYLELELDQDIIIIDSYIQNELKNKIKEIAPDAKLIILNRNSMVFALKNKIEQVVDLLKELRENEVLKSQHGVVNYGVYDTTLEESYMRIIESHHIGGRSRLYRMKKNAYEDSDSIDLIDSVSEAAEKTMFRNFSLWLGQLKSLLIKRFYFDLHNRIYFLLALVVPIVLCFLHLLFHRQPMKILEDVDIASYSMPIHPWLMRPNREKISDNYDPKNTLITFYKRKNYPQNLFEDLRSTYENFYFGNVKDLPEPTKIEKLYSSDKGNSGLACLSHKIPFIPKCNKNTKPKWTFKSNHYSFINRKSQKCSCTKNFTELSCSSLLKNRTLELPSTLTAVNDILINMNTVNLSDYLYKSYETNKLKLYGGYQFYILNKYSLVLKQIEKSNFLHHLTNNLPNSKAFSDSIKSYLRLDSEKLVYTRVWANPKGFIASTAYINVLDNLLLKLYSNDNKTNNQSAIFVNVKPSNLYLNRVINSFMIHGYLPLILALIRLVILVVSLTFILSSFMIFIIDERTTDIKRQQLISGLSSELYWFVNFIWDYLKYIILSSILIVLLIVFKVNLITSTDILHYFVLLVYLSGAALILQVYLLTFLFNRPIVGFVSFFLINLFLVIFSLAICVVFESVPLNEHSTLIEKTMKNVMKTFIFIPQVNVGRGFFNLTFKYYNYQLRQNDYVNFISTNMAEFHPTEPEILGNTYRNLFLNIFLELLLLLLFEHWQYVDRIFWIIYLCIQKILPFKQIKKSIRSMTSTSIKLSKSDDFDVINEKISVHNMPARMFSVKIDNLRKVYFNLRMLNCCTKNKNKFSVVDGITFGVAPGECFGLLGLNGAGKSTVFNMIIGRERMTSGDAYVSGVSVRSGIRDAHKIGYCPQDDALHDLLTVQQELHLYCGISGVPKGKVTGKLIQSLLEKLILQQYGNKLIRDLSGGNKRKLSIAIALIGNPNVVLLDEPTAGTDSDARRHIWAQIQYLTSAEQNRSVILTTHDMQDCEALCHRLAIMVDGKIICIGTRQHLKMRHGGYYMVNLRRKESLKHELNKRLEEIFHGKMSVYEENVVNNVYRFKQDSLDLDNVFKELTELKHNDLIKDFSINQINLGDIFLKTASEVLKNEE